MGVQIIADSACDLPMELIEQHHLEVLPLLVIMKGKEYRDDIDIEPEEMYTYMKQGGSVKTAQVPYSTFDEKFRQLINKPDEYIYIAFSSELSGTYQTAQVVINELKEDFKEVNIEAIDSKSASIGYGLIVLKALELAKAGSSKQEIIEKIHFYIKHIEHIFTVGDIDYLYRGGRVSKTTAFVASVLNVKPILDMQEGKLIPIGKVRGRKKALQKMVAMVGERGDRLQEQVVAINHANDIEAALKVKGMLQEAYGIKEFIINQVGCVIGSHSGPGTLSIFFFNRI